METSVAAATACLALSPPGSYKPVAVYLAELNREYILLCISAGCVLISRVAVAAGRAYVLTASAFLVPLQRITHTWKHGKRRDPGRRWLRQR